MEIPAKKVPHRFQAEPTAVLRLAQCQFHHWRPTLPQPKSKSTNRKATSRTTERENIMKKQILIALISVVFFPLEANAWLVQCKPGTTCQPACKNAGGKILTHPANGSKWCNIPSNIKNITESQLDKMRKAGLETENIIQSFDQNSE